MDRNTNAHHQRQIRTFSRLVSRTRWLRVPFAHGRHTDPDDSGHAEYRGLAALLLRALGTAVLVAAGTVAALAWIEGWEGAPDFGVATYLFWPMLVGSVLLIGFATRFSSAEAGQAQDADAQLQ